MLTKRANVLFEDKRWQDLLVLAKAKGTSVGELIRSAVDGSYFSNNILEKRKKAIQDIMAMRKVFKGKIDYEEYINYGRER